MKLSPHQKKIVMQLKKDNGQIIRGDGFAELERRYNGVWDGESIRRDTFNALVQAEVIVKTGATGFGAEIWKVTNK